MPLTMSQSGHTTTIKRVTGRDEVRRHLAELGFIEGAELTVIQEAGGNMILEIKGSRVALGQSMAQRIIV